MDRDAAHLDAAPLDAASMDSLAAGGILAIETSQARGSVAWSADREAPLEEELFSIGLVHGRELIPRIEALRERVGFERTDIAVVAVSAGPGSFTGVRIGVAAAKALAFALGRPALAVSSLEVTARNVTSEGPCAVLLDARRHRAHGARFVRTADRLERTTRDATWPVEDLLAQLPEGTRLLGAGARTLPGLEGYERLPEDRDLPRAAEVARLARERLVSIAGGHHPPPPEFVDPHRLVPFYLLASAAEEAGGLPS